MIFKIALAFAFVVGIVFLPDLAPAQVPVAIDKLFDAYKKPGAPAIAAVVVQNGKIAYRGAFGLADIANAVSATSRTAFEIGSVSKMFTAFMVERLIHDGRLSGDDDVRTFIPELPRYEAIITVRNLLQHTSGVRDYFELLGMRGFRFDDSTTQNEVVRLIERQGEINFRPGSEYRYSNSEYVLLALIVEKVTGRSFAAAAKESIFTPLGMSDALFLADRTTLIRNKALSYITTGKGVISLSFNSDVNGPSGAWMSGASGWFSWTDWRRKKIRVWRQ
jgi:CubicO group peptidase (beta-lactamase class C family)